MRVITWVEVLREWFGAERYARDYEYLDHNYRQQAEAVARLTQPDDGPVRVPYAYCCAEGGGYVSACGCDKKDHGKVWVDAKSAPAYMRPQ